jgi:hypothetical protein
MFNGNFAEGQALSTSSPRTIPLPEDDQESMLLICRIAHLQTADIPEELSADSFADFADFAITCDKYQCGAAVQAWSKVWVSKLLKKAPCTNFEKTLLATYILDMPQEFYEVCTILALTNVNDTKVFASDYLPTAIFDTLRDNKRKGEEQIHTALGTVTQYLGVCEASRRRLGTFSSIFDILPFGHCSQLPLRPSNTQL